MRHRSSPPASLRASALTLTLTLLLAGVPSAAWAQEGPESFEAKLATDAAAWNPTPEELEKALKQWVQEYVVYIVTDEERKIFEALPTNEQKLAFTERFWDIRDPTPGTRRNEYRQSHFERWVTANRRFSAGKAGWRTDRGRVFIVLGPPNNLQRNPMGRDGSERASEVWTYNLPDNPLLPGVYDLSFVDFKGVGEFELVSDLDAAASAFPGQFGVAESPLDVVALRRHASSIYDERFLVENWTDPTLVAQDFLEFQSNLRELLRIPEIHLERLESLRRADVEARVDFNAFPIARSVDYFEAIAGDTAIDVTLGLEWDRIMAAPVGFNYHYSVDTYVALERDGKVVAQDNKRLNFTLTQEEAEPLGATQILQTHQLLVPPGEYELVLMARDNTGTTVGRRLETILVPDLATPAFRLSSMILASQIRQVATGPDTKPRDFQRGDVRVVPNVSRVYYPDQSLLLYLQAYGLGIDPSANLNRVKLSGEIRRDGKMVRRIPAQYPAPAPMTRQSFSLGMPLGGYTPGIYEVVMVVEDQVAGKSIEARGEFAILPPSLGSTGSR